MAVAQLRRDGFASSCIPRALPAADACTGVLGEAPAVAERTQVHALPGTISCSAAARAAYLASSYLFVPRGASPAALPVAPTAVVAAPAALSAEAVSGSEAADEKEFTVWPMPLSQQQRAR